MVTVNQLTHDIEAEVLLNKDLAAHIGFNSMEDASKWANRMERKIASNQRKVAEAMGEHPVWLIPKYQEVECEPA